MLTLLLAYFLIGVFIFWLGAAVFGVDHDVPLSWQLGAIALWPLAVTLAGYRALRQSRIDQAAMEGALRRHELRARPPRAKRAHRPHARPVQRRLHS